MFNVGPPDTPAIGADMSRLIDVSKRTADQDRRDAPSSNVLEHKRESNPPAEAPVGRVDAHLVSLVAAESIEAEQYRGLRYVVEQMRQAGEGTGTLVGVCSPIPGDGKSVTAINLAGSLAQDPKARVLLIEVDMRRPSVTIGDHLTLRNPTGRGLVDAILDPELTLEQVTLYLAAFNLAVLPAGRELSAPYEALKAPRFSELLVQARRRFDYVILDAPPVVPVPDCRLIAKWVDGFLMVVAAQRTPRAALEQALDLMGPEKILGLVFNGLDRSASRHYGYYGYGYGRRKDRNPRRWWKRVLGK